MQQWLPLRLQTKLLANSENGASSTADSERTNYINNFHQDEDSAKLNNLKFHALTKSYQKNNSSNNNSSNSNAKHIPGLIDLTAFHEENLNQHQQNDILDSPIKRTFGYNEPLWLKNIDSHIKSDHPHHKNIMKSLKILNYKISEIIHFETYLDNWPKFLNYRKRLQQICIQLFENNLRFCCEENLDSYFWKLLYYIVMQFLKNSYNQYGKKSSNNIFNICNELKEKSLFLIEDGLNFYEILLKSLERKYQFQRNNLLTMNYINTKNKLIILWKLSIQKIYINIGDLLRYKEHFTGITNYNYNEAKQYYEKAQKLITTNGIPYNQLAIIALNYNNYFDAIYYHIRSLTTSNPIVSAKESLKVLLDEIRKKYDEKFQIKLENSTTSINNLSLSSSSSNKFTNITDIRKEIWIHPNGSRKYRFNSNPLITNNDELNINEKLINITNNEENLSNNELKKQFLTSYMYIIGKLFSGIGLENFENIMFQMLYEFKMCMVRYPELITNQKLLEIIAINIFLFDYQNKNDTGSDDISNTITMKEVQSYAFKVNLFMFGIIINYTNDILEQYNIEINNENNKNNDNIQNIPIELNELLQPIKVFCNWLSLNINLCRKKLQLNDSNEITPWKSFAKLLTQLSKFILFKNYEYFNENLPNCKPIQLEEDIFLSGFSPLKNILNKFIYTNIEMNEKNLKIYYRIEQIVYFAENFLCQGDPPILKLDKNNEKEKIFTKLILSKDIETTKTNNKINKVQNKQIIFSENVQDKLQNIIISDDEIIDIDLTTNSIKLNVSNLELYELKNKKTILEKSKKAQDIYKEKLKDILEDSDNITIVEVKPKYLIPDTNCFIDYLNELEQLLLNKNTGFNLMIPLVVVNELEGLSKGFKLDGNIVTNSKIHHFDEVAGLSEQALEFIKSKNNTLNIKCCTTKGSILKNSSAFTLEEDDILFSNDDKILTTAVSLATENILCTENERSFIRTEVVLLTTDRNLRVKALSKNLAVSGLKEFLNWTEGKDFNFIR